MKGSSHPLSNMSGPKFPPNNLPQVYQGGGPLGPNLLQGMPPQQLGQGLPQQQCGQGDLSNKNIKCSYKVDHNRLTLANEVLMAMVNIVGQSLGLMCLPNKIGVLEVHNALQVHNRRLE
jgi:hypothetical protein